MQSIKSELKQWVGLQLGTEKFCIQPLTGDASFRSYYRVTHEDRTYIVMWAPPDRETTESFVRIAREWKQAGLLVPNLWGWEAKQGFILLSDFGDTLLFDKLTSQTVELYYDQAMQIIPQLQVAHLSTGLPPFNEAHVRLELSYFQDWFVEKLLNIEITKPILGMLEKVFTHLVQGSHAQPQSVIHRDFHSRNLMVLPENEKLGIIDFQDAMIGPITYDLVSLLKDCYIDWPPEQVESWATFFCERLNSEKLFSPIQSSQFLQWFDWMGLQRHLKVLGIFSRLKLRDNKPHYLAFFPRIIDYVRQVTRQYSEFAEFDSWLIDEILPRLQTEPQTRAKISCEL